MIQLLIEVSPAGRRHNCVGTICMHSAGQANLDVQAIHIRADHRKREMRDGRWEITNPTGNEKRRMTRDWNREMRDGTWEMRNER